MLGERGRFARRGAHRGAARASRPPASRCRSTRVGRQGARRRRASRARSSSAGATRWCEQLVKIGKARARRSAARRGRGADRAAARSATRPPRWWPAPTPPAPTPPACYLARRVPYVWDNARGALSLDEVAHARRTFPAGARAARARRARSIRELDAVLGDLEGQDDRVVRRQAVPRSRPTRRSTRIVAAKLQQGRHRSAGRRSTSSRHHRPGHRSSTTRFDVPWEVDEFWAKFKSRRAAEGQGRVEGRARGAAERVARGAPTASPSRRARELIEGRRRRPERARAVGLQAGLSLADRAGDSRAEGQGRCERCTSRSRSTTRTSRRNTSSTWCRAAGSTSCIRSTRSSSASSASPKDAFTLELVDSAEGHLHLEATDAAGKVVYTRDVQSRRSSSASTSTSSPAGRGWTSRPAGCGDGRRAVGRRRAHRDRSRALLGSLPVEGAAAHLRQRDEGDRQPADCPTSSRSTATSTSRSG